MSNKALKAVSLTEEEWITVLTGLRQLERIDFLTKEAETIRLRIHVKMAMAEWVEDEKIAAQT